MRRDEIEVAKRENELRLYRSRRILEERALGHELLEEWVQFGPDEAAIEFSICVSKAEALYQRQLAEGHQPPVVPQQPMPPGPESFPRAVNAARPATMGRTETMEALGRMTHPESLRAALRRGGPAALEELRQQMHQMLGRPGASPQGDITTLSASERARSGLISQQERAATLAAVREATQPAQQMTFYGRTAAAGRRGLDGYEARTVSADGPGLPQEATGGTAEQKVIQQILREKRAVAAMRRK